MTTAVTDNFTERLRNLASCARSAGSQSEANELAEALAGEIREIINAERLAAATRLAGWLAHRINNPLGSISGNAQLLARRLERDLGESAEPYLRYIEAIKSQTERSAGITAELLEFTRPRDPILRPTDVRQAVEEAVELAGFGAGQGCAVKVKIAPGVPQAHSDKALLVRALYEVILNAMQASGQDGEVTVSASCQPEGIEIATKDTGHGIAAEVVEQVFDPFFSTREKARGLGLTTTLSIMREIGGTVAVADSTPSGATVVLTVPVDGR